MKAIRTLVAGLALACMSIGAHAQATGVVSTIEVNKSTGWVLFTLTGGSACTTGPSPGFWYAATDPDYVGLRADLRVSKMVGSTIIFTYTNEATNGGTYCRVQSWKMN